MQNKILLIVFSNTKHHKRSIFFSKMSFQGELMPNDRFKVEYFFLKIEMERFYLQRDNCISKVLLENYMQVKIKY